MMAGSLNKVMLIGNLGADPESRATPNGAQVVNFRIACSENWKDQSGQKHEWTEWVTCVAWRQQAEIAAKYLRKGSKVYVEGKLQTRTWEDKQGGGKRYATEVLVDRFMMLDGHRDDDHGERRDPQYPRTESALADDDPNLPF
jgi:single-strand DNA-binding protein